MSKSTAQTVADHSSRDGIQTELNVFIHEVGERVLAARHQQRMSRRVLSELSGVSQRTIVLLETGAGNISIALLFRVAHALGRPIDWFVCSELAHNGLKAQRICLIGLRGAGKSTLGTALSDALSTDFVEANTEIESLSGFSVQELIDLYGQEGYRRLEKQALENTVANYDNVILAAAGGVVVNPDTYDYLLKHFHTVWLKAEPEEHMERVRMQGDERPMAGNPEAMKELKSILTSRESLYRSAESVLDTSGKSVAVCSDELMSLIRPLMPL